MSDDVSEHRRTFEVAWTIRASHEVNAIAATIAADRPVAARRWLGDLTGRVRQLADFPLSGRPIEEMDDPRMRELLFGKYRIVYMVGDGVVEIATVFDGR